MSQHYFETKHREMPVTILMGWDRPLQGFFMVIESDRAGADDDDYIYSNLTDRELRSVRGLPDSLDHFLAKLAEFGLSVPQQMLREIRADAAADVGNRQVWYAAEGAIRASS